MAVPAVFLDRPIAGALGLGRAGELVVLLGGIFAGQLLGQQVLIWAVRPYLWEVIGGLCLRCGYDLRATPERCPECGWEAEGAGGRT